MNNTGLFQGNTPAMSYQEACTYLDSLQFFRIKLGLETMRLLLQELGAPQQHLRIIHIAGTNGKGSVGATLATVLSQAGYRAGFYSSPHLVDVRERFAIGGMLISKEEFSAQMGMLHDLFERTGLHPTYFECTTLLALNWFAVKKVDVAILETGLGGRLDATNVVQSLVSVITDISRDHEQYLGSDIASIAAEKAGIIKPGVPVVFSGRSEGSTAVIASFCERLGSKLYLLGRDFFAEGGDGHLNYTGIHAQSWRGLSLALAGRHQIVNASLALAALDVLASSFPVSSDDIRTALARVRWPGRMEYLQVTCQHSTRRFLLEGAHNEAGIQALCATLEAREAGKRIFLVWGNMADKHMHSARSQLFARAEAIILTQAENKRSASPQVLWESLEMAEQQKSRCIVSVQEALQAAMAQSGEQDLICVAGSLYLVGRARSVLVPEEKPVT